MSKMNSLVCTQNQYKKKLDRNTVIFYETHIYKLISLYLSLHIFISFFFYEPGPFI